VNVHEHGRTLALVAVGYNRIGKDQTSTVTAYKQLSTAERAFRSLKTVDLEVRPIYHRRAEPWPDNMPVPTFGPRMVCTRCGIIGANAGPNWQEQPPRESLTGAQWR
jgi:hypothetical protein